MTEGTKALEHDVYCPYRPAAVLCAALFALFCGCRASVAHGRQPSYVKVPGPPLSQILRLWSAAGEENFQYPGKNTSQSFDAILWARLAPEGREPRIRLLSLVARRSNKFCMVQIASNGLVGYCTSDGTKFRSMLFDPRGSGALMVVASKAPVIETFFGVAPSQSHEMWRMGVLKKPGRHSFFVSLSRIWLRLASRHASRISYDGRNQSLTIRTRTLRSLRLTFTGWPISPRWPHRLAVAISAVDIRFGFPHLKSSLHLRLSPFGLFQRPPYFAKGSTAQVIKPDTRRIGRSNFVARYQASILATGRISAPAAVARRRFLNWAVGQKEAGVLDDWIYKGIAPVQTVKRTKAGGSE